MPKAFAGPRTFTVSVTIGHEDLHTATATIVIDADDIPGRNRRPGAIPRTQGRDDGRSA